ncbi:MAG: hypothetical protein KC466_15535 [Myxococcales bacterium]|nr:hypothetical protein [Myxococcales bacterium]
MRGARPIVLSTFPCLVASVARAGPLDYDLFKSLRDPRPDCDRADSFAPQRVQLRDARGRWNLALLKTARAHVSSTIRGWPGRHQRAFLNDGWWNSCRSWIPARMPARAGVDLGAEYSVGAIAFGSEYQPYYHDRNPSKFTISVAGEDRVFREVVRFDDPRDPVKRRRVWELEPPVVARYVLIDLERSFRGNPRIDELEIYGDSAE